MYRKILAMVGIVLFAIVLFIFLGKYLPINHNNLETYDTGTVSPFLDRIIDKYNSILPDIKLHIIADESAPNTSDPVDGIFTIVSSGDSVNHLAYIYSFGNDGPGIKAYLVLYDKNNKKNYIISRDIHSIDRIFYVGDDYLIVLVSGWESGGTDFVVYDLHGLTKIGQVSYAMADCNGGATISNISSSITLVNNPSTSFCNYDSDENGMKIWAKNKGKILTNFSYGVPQTTLGSFVPIESLDKFREDTWPTPEEILKSVHIETVNFNDGGSQSNYYLYFHIGKTHYKYDNSILQKID